MTVGKSSGPNRQHLYISVTEHLPLSIGSFHNWHVSSSLFSLPVQLFDGNRRRRPDKKFYESLVRPDLLSRDFHSKLPNRLAMPQLAKFRLGSNCHGSATKFANLVFSRKVLALAHHRRSC